LLQLLRVKAEHRCFNYLARDHRITQCRDPPRCILCSKSGHKARLCKTYSGVPARAVPRAGAEATSARWQEKKEAGGMEFIPGKLEQRPAKIKACAARTEAVREAERELSLHSLVGVLLDACVRITCEQVRWDVLRQLRIPDHLLAVSKLREATFLLQFERPELRNAVLGRGMLSTGLTKMHFLPWTRQYPATSASKQHYRVRVCIEGIPAHVASVEVASRLFPASAYVELIDTERETEDEKACLCVWVWIADPDSIAIGRC